MYAYSQRYALPGRYPGSCNNYVGMRTKQVVRASSPPLVAVGAAGTLAEGWDTGGACGDKRWATCVTMVSSWVSDNWMDLSPSAAASWSPSALASCVRSGREDPLSSVGDINTRWLLSLAKIAVDFCTLLCKATASWASSNVRCTHAPSQPSASGAVNLF